MENISDNKSQEQKLRNGAQAIRSSLYIVRSELQEHKNEAQAIRSSTIQLEINHKNLGARHIHLKMNHKCLEINNQIQ